MKKKRIMLAAVVCIFLGGILFSIGWAMGGRGIEFDFSKKDKLKIARELKEYSVSDMDYEAFRGVIMDVPDCNIYVGRSKNGKFGVDMRLYTYDYDDIEFYITDEEDGQPGYMVIKNNSETPYISFNFDFTGEKEQYIKLYIPDEKLDYINAGTSNESIVFENISAENEICADSSNANITFKNVSSEYVYAQTTNGSVKMDGIQADGLVIKTTNDKAELKNAAAGSVNIKSTNDKIELENVNGADAVVETTNGNINLHNVRFGSSIDARTTNDSIMAALEGHPSDYSYEIRTSNDLIRIGGGKYEDYYTGGDGPIKVRLETSNGKVTVEYR